MALLKTIELDSGIVLNYHRIVTITKITNHSTVIEIASYTSKDKRDQEVKQNENAGSLVEENMKILLLKIGMII